jgi:GT2 family glycosyltransferase
MDRLLKISAVSRFSISLYIVVNGETINGEIDERFFVSFEKNLGYAHVRNKALNVIQKNSNLIFIDDDELPTDLWLNSIIAMHFEFPNDIIVGPVYPDLSRQVEKEISLRIKSIAQYAKVKNKSKVPQGGSGNMLIPNSVLSADYCYFDPFFNLGGEDTDLCFRARKNKTKIRFAEFASLLEVEDKDKLNLEYLNKRLIMDSVNYSLIIRRNSSIGLCIYRAIKISIRISQHLFLLYVFRKHSRIQIQALIQSLKSLITGKKYSKN